jgi:spore maturation protein CgeB
VKVELVGINDPLLTRSSKILREIDYRVALARPTKLAYSAIKTLRLENFLAKKKPDFFLTFWKIPEFQKAAARAGCKTILWGIDDPASFSDSNWFDYCNNLDYVLTMTKGAIGRYKAMGVQKVEWLPLCFDPIALEPRLSFKKTYDMVLVANYQHDRKSSFELIVLPLISRFKKSMHLFGRNPDGPLIRQASCHGPIPRSQLGPVYWRTKVAINIHRGAFRKTPLGLNLRTFEILGSGQFELMDSIPGIEELFVPGKDLVIAEDGTQAIELAEYFLAHDEEREKIAAAGHKKAMLYHTVKHRAQFILEIMRKLQ